MLQNLQERWLQHSPNAVHSPFRFLCFHLNCFLQLGEMVGTGGSSSCSSLSHRLVAAVVSIEPPIFDFAPFLHFGQYFVYKKKVFRVICKPEYLIKCFTMCCSKALFNSQWVFKLEKSVSQIRKFANNKHSNMSWKIYILVICQSLLKKITTNQVL